MVKTRSSSAPRWTRKLPLLRKKTPITDLHKSVHEDELVEEKTEETPSVTNNVEEERRTVDTVDSTYEKPHSEPERENLGTDSEATESEQDYFEMDDKENVQDGLGEDDEQNLAGIIQSITHDFPNGDDLGILSYEDVLDPEFIELFAKGSNNVKKTVHFNDRGQPIGEGSAAFSSDLGSITRKHCPICFETWGDVPGQIKDMLWKLVTDKYVVSLAYKHKILQRIHKYWRSFKSTIRIKYYDSYDTNEERKRHRPPGVRQDVWNIFVDNQSSPAAQARRMAGKFARKAVKSPHVSGRIGAARIEEALKKENPSTTVTRTDIYLAMHSRKDGSCPTPELAEKVEKIKAIAQQNPSSVNLDIDHDPVAQVYGRERKGQYVRGMGLGVSRTSLLHSAPLMELLERERSLRIAVEDEIAGLNEQAVSEAPAPPSVEQIPARVTRSSTRRGLNSSIAPESDTQRSPNTTRKRRGFAECEQTEGTSVVAKKNKNKSQRVEDERELDTDPELHGGNSETDGDQDDMDDGFAVDEEQEPGRESMDSGVKKVVHFNDKGQPIGEGAVPFTAYLGTIMRKHCPISYEKWGEVPVDVKDTLWNLVTDKFEVSSAYKYKVLQRVHCYWGKYKNILRTKHYDCFATDAERKKNCPIFVSQPVWDNFVDNESSPAAQARRESGRRARKAMKTPQLSGRRGAARTEEKLKMGNPLATVTRTQLYLAMHSREDGTYPTPEMREKVEKVKAIVRENPDSVNFDLDRDPVAQVYGPQKNVVGMGQGVSRNSLIHAAHVLDKLQLERMLRVSAQEKLANLKGQSPQGPPPEVPPTPPSVAEQPPPDEELRRNNSSNNNVCVSTEEQLAVLRQHIVLQDERIGALQEEKEQMTDLKKQIISQGLMIADMKELIMRLCS